MTRKGDPVHGWLILDKPAGLSSAAAVGRVKRALNAAKLGHAGTLDPLASGVLPLALGEACKTVAYMVDGRKRYRFAIRWGEMRDTDDAEGRVTATSAQRPDAAAIEAVLPRFVGRVVQTPPRYSAIKIAGVRAYALARAGAAVAPAPRLVEIDALTLLASDGAEATFEMACGKGVYVRSVARDLALALGAAGHVSRLRRTAVGRFDEAAAISLDSLIELAHIARSSERLLPLQTALDDIPALAVTEDEAELIRSGRSIDLGARPASDRMFGPAAVVFCQSVDGRPVALARVEGCQLRPARVFNL